MKQAIVTGANCGNGILIGEFCDDANTADGDGCSSICLIEEGWSCTDPVPGISPTNVVADWSFEGGVPNTDWTTYSTFTGISGFPICDQSNCSYDVANTGDGFVWIGGPPTGVTSSVAQILTIPSTATGLTLHTWRQTCDDVGDTLHVAIDGTDIGTQMCDATDAGYVMQTYSVAAYADECNPSPSPKISSFNYGFVVKNTL